MPHCDEKRAEDWRRQVAWLAPKSRTRLLLGQESGHLETPQGSLQTVVTGKFFFVQRRQRRVRGVSSLARGHTASLCGPESGPVTGVASAHGGGDRTTQPNAYSSPGDMAQPRTQQAALPPLLPASGSTRGQRHTEKGPAGTGQRLLSLCFPRPCWTNSGFPPPSCTGVRDLRRNGPGSTVSKRGHGHLRTRCSNEASWATRPCPRVAGLDLGFRTRGPRGMWPGACSGTAEARGDSALRGHTPHPCFLLQLPRLVGQLHASRRSEEHRGTVWPGWKHPQGGPYLPGPTSLGSPTAASQDPSLPRSPGLQRRVPGWWGGIRHRPHPGRPVGLARGPAAAESHCPPLSSPRPRWLLGGGGGAGRCVGRYPPTHQSPASS